MKASPYFFLDIIYIHEAPSQDNKAKVGIVFSFRIILKERKAIVLHIMRSFRKKTLARKIYILCKAPKLSLLASLYFDILIVTV